MTRFVVVEPCFSEGHILEAHVRNICEYLKPDDFIIGEGMFSTGPESSIVGNRAASFRKRFTKDGVRSFDIELMRDIIHACKVDYPDTNIHWVEVDHPLQGDSAGDCYRRVFLLPQQLLSLGPDDILFLTETDMLFGREEGKQIRETCAELRPGEHMSVDARQIYVNPRLFYGHRHRRGGWKLGDGTSYKKFLDVYYHHDQLGVGMSNRLSVGWHYEWMRPQGAYTQMRLEQTYKGHITPAMEDSCVRIERNPGASDEELLKTMRDSGIYRYLPVTLSPFKLADHPIHIHNHPNMVKYMGALK